MKKFLLLIGALISFAIQVSATSESVSLTVNGKDNLGKGTKVRRTPTHLPLDVFYCNETRQVEVSCVEEVEAQVFLYDENGNVLDCSPYINVMLNVSCDYRGIITIFIDSEYWVATGEIVV